MFQSTPLREGRPVEAGVKFDAHYVSIHAPARGATGYGWMTWKDYNVSIHAPARGAT